MILDNHGLSIRRLTDNAVRFVVEQQAALGTASYNRNDFQSGLDFSQNPG